MHGSAPASNSTNGVVGHVATRCLAQVPSRIVLSLLVVMVDVQLFCIRSTFSAGVSARPNAGDTKQPGAM